MSTEIIESKPPSRSGYKETVITWLNPKCRVMSNNDIPIVGDVADALVMIPELARYARTDRWIEECAERIRKNEKRSLQKQGIHRKTAVCGF